MTTKIPNSLKISVRYGIGHPLYNEKFELANKTSLVSSKAYNSIIDRMDDDESSQYGDYLERQVDLAELMRNVSDEIGLQVGHGFLMNPNWQTQYIDMIDFILPCPLSTWKDYVICRVTVTEDKPEKLYLAKKEDLGEVEEEPQAPWDQKGVW